MIVDPDIRRAWTLPGEYYTNSDRYQQSLESVFARSWQIIANSEQMRVPGQVQPVTLLEGSLNEPLVLTRDMQDQLRCVSNVCTHRGCLVAEQPSMERFLRCRYHGRRFGLDGKFQDMPEFEGVEGFPSETDNLASVALGEYPPLIFASLDPKVDFDSFAQPVRDRLAGFPLDEIRFDPARSRDYLLQANWALYVENYLEGFHIPFVHGGLNRLLDYGQYRTELFEWGNLQVGVAASGQPAINLPRCSPDYGQSIVAYYFWLFPNTMINVYAGWMSVNIIRPLSVSKTRVSYLSYVWDESLIAQGAGSNTDRVEREDEAIVESVQKGLRSRLYKRGRYSPTREMGVHQFHRMLSETIDE